MTQASQLPGQTRAARAIILAAGTGSRLRPHTDKRPKCMVPVLGRSILQHQMAVMKSCGIDDITVVTGHAAGAVDLPGIHKRHNAAYMDTNMVASLFCAEPELHGQGDVVVSYGDIIYEKGVLAALLADISAIGVCIDQLWRRYWEMRMEDPLADAETLKLDASGGILELGKKPKSYDEIQGQYIGLFKISGRTLERFRSFYHGLDRAASYDGQPFANMYMTSYLQALIDAGFAVKAVPIENGWLEVDTLQDLDCYERLAQNGALATFFNPRA